MPERVDPERILRSALEEMFSSYVL